MEQTIKQNQKSLVSSGIWMRELRYYFEFRKYGHIALLKNQESVIKLSEKMEEWLCSSN